ncbi:hypothetical protein L681_08515 [Stenotrophomonas maltophilia MF89]|nr:hypothetical protein L681_08515 [Stenotrophomonas maltophilia MF89]
MKRSSSVAGLWETPTLHFFLHRKSWLTGTTPAIWSYAVVFRLIGIPRPSRFSLEREIGWHPHSF